jgi:hypothetical protein
MASVKRPPGVYLPSPETILLVCAEIRSGWSETVHRMRGKHMRPVPYEIPVVRRVELAEILEEELEHDSAGGRRA